MGSIGDLINSTDKDMLTELVDSGGLSENENEIVNGYYTKKLGLTGDEDNDIEILYNFYIERINDKSSTQAIRETIHEYIVFFNLRNLAGSEVVAHKIAMVGRKNDPGKKNLSYLIGCLRNVLEYGLSSTNSPIEKRLVASFENRYKIKLSSFARQRLFAIAANNGIAEVLFTLIEHDINIEDILLDMFEQLLGKSN